MVVATGPVENHDYLKQRPSESTPLLNFASPDYSGFPHTKACNARPTGVLGESYRSPDR